MTLKEYVETLTDEQKNILKNAISLTKKAIEERKKAIENHRNMWNWIVDETLRLKRIIGDFEYLEKTGVHNLYNESFCCQFNFDMEKLNGSHCNFCPLKFSNDYNEGGCGNKKSPLYLWAVYSDRFSEDCDYKKSAKYAKEVAELPEAELNELDLLKKFL